MIIKNSNLITNFLNDSNLYNVNDVSTKLFYKLVNELNKLGFDLLEYVHELGYIERDILIEYQDHETDLYSFLIEEADINSLVLIENDNREFWRCLSVGVVRAAIKDLLNIKGV